MRLVALVALLATAAHAGDAPLAVQEVDGGVFVPSEIRVLEGKAAVAKDARITYLESHLDSNIPVWLVITLTVVGVVAGGAAVFAGCKASSAGCK